MARMTRRRSLDHRDRATATRSSSLRDMGGRRRSLGARRRPRRRARGARPRPRRAGRPPRGSACGSRRAAACPRRASPPRCGTARRAPCWARRRSFGRGRSSARSPRTATASPSAWTSGDGVVAPAGTDAAGPPLDEALRRLAAARPALVVFTDAERDGALAGPDLGALARRRRGHRRPGARLGRGAFGGRHPFARRRCIRRSPGAIVGRALADGLLDDRGGARRRIH